MQKAPLLTAAPLFAFLAVPALMLAAAAPAFAAGLTGPASKIEVSVKVTRDPLGIDFKVNDYGSVIVEIANNGDAPLAVGDDLYLWVDAAPGSHNVALAMPEHNAIARDKLSDFVYACGANNFSRINAESVLWAFGPGGNWLDMKGFEKKHEGAWPRKVDPAEKAALKHRLATWPGADRGWLATPAFDSSDGKGFRLLVPFGMPGNLQPMAVSMAPESLLTLIADEALPVPVRTWAACWLASSKGDKGWTALAKLLPQETTDVALRKAFVKSLATQASPKALDSVDAALWKPSTPEELQLICYYAFTWSDHPEAKKFIEKACKHPNVKIKNEATAHLAKK